MVIISNKVRDKIRIVRVGNMFEDPSKVKNGYFKIMMEIGNASLGLKEFKDLGSDFKWEVMDGF